MLCRSSPAAHTSPLPPALQVFGPGKCVSVVAITDTQGCEAEMLALLQLAHQVGERGLTLFLLFPLLCMVGVRVWVGIALCGMGMGVGWGVRWQFVMQEGFCWPMRCNARRAGRPSFGAFRGMPSPHAPHLFPCHRPHVQGHCMFHGPN